MSTAPIWCDLGVKLLSANKIDVIDHSISENSCTDMFRIWSKITEYIKGTSGLANEIESRFVHSRLYTILNFSVV